MRNNTIEDDGLMVHRCISKHGSGEGSTQVMTVREIAKRVKLTQGRTVECVEGCGFLSFLAGPTTGRPGDRVVRIHPMPEIKAADSGRARHRKPKSSRRFRTVFRLSVFPDFAKVEAGLELPPWVNHDEMDFEKLAELLATTFKYGPQVSLCVANDTIDQVTFAFRVGEFGRSTGDPMMRDFGRRFMELIPSEMPSVVDVRKAWWELHNMRDRHRAPPPLMVLFAIEAEDFEDAMVWLMQNSMLLGVDLMERFWASSDGAEINREGVLPATLHAGLEAIFGCKYKKVTLLEIMEADPVPAWASEAMQGGLGRGGTRLGR